MRITLILVMLGATLASAGAQTVHTGAVKGTVADVAPAPRVQTRGYGRRIDGAVPLVRSADGRMFANFGRGYEQVIRQCGPGDGIQSGFAQAPGVSQPSIVQPSVTQPRPGVENPLPYTPPIPEEPTASQQLLTSAPGSIGSTRACWTRDQRGQLVAARP